VIQLLQAGWPSALLACVGHGPSAASDVGTQPFKGIGFVKCAELIDWSQTDTDLTPVRSWFYGYWTGLNLKLVSDDDLMRDLNSELVKPEALMARMIGECYSQREELLVNVGQNFFELLSELQDSEVETNQ